MSITADLQTHTQALIALLPQSNKNRLRVKALVYNRLTLHMAVVVVSVKTDIK